MKRQKGFAPSIDLSRPGGPGCAAADVLIFQIEIPGRKTVHFLPRALLRISFSSKCLHSQIKLQPTPRENVWGLEPSPSKINTSRSPAVRAENQTGRPRPSSWRSRESNKKHQHRRGKKANSPALLRAHNLFPEHPGTSRTIQHIRGSRVQSKVQLTTHTSSPPGASAARVRTALDQCRVVQRRSRPSCSRLRKKRDRIWHDVLNEIRSVKLRTRWMINRDMAGLG